MASGTSIIEEPLDRFVPSHPIEERWQHGGVGAITEDRKWVVTSPNCEYIPTPYIGQITLEQGPDGHFGAGDPILWPQIITPDSRHPWLPAIRRRPASSSDRHWLLWQVLTQEHVTVSPNSTALFVVTSKHRTGLKPIYSDITTLVDSFELEHGQHQELRWLFTTARDAFFRLGFPATFRDLVCQHATFQRNCLYVLAWFQWHVVITHALPFPAVVPVPTKDLSGGFTTSPSIAQRLLDADVPVWFLRSPERLCGHENIKWVESFTPFIKHLPFDKPEDLAFHQNEICGRARVAQVTSGSRRHFDWIHSLAFQYADLESIPFPKQPDDNTKSGNTAAGGVSAEGASYRGTTLCRRLPEPRRASKSSSRFQPYARETRTAMAPTEKEKFKPDPHSLLAPAIRVWELALSRVELHSSPQIPAWRYLVPEPRLLIAAQNPERQTRFVCNWLRVRQPWLYLLSNFSMTQHNIGPLTAAQWREYLNTSDISQQRSGKQRRKAALNHQVDVIFRKVFKGEVPGSNVPALWYGVDVEKTVGRPCWTRICHEVTWELGEIAFRLELLMLDKHLVPNTGDPMEDRERLEQIAAVFPASRGVIMKTIPRQPDGLASVERKDRAVHLESLRRLLSRWPGAPELIKDAAPFTNTVSAEIFDERELQLATFYCQKFFDVTGRAAIIPRVLLVVPTK